MASVRVGAVAVGFETHPPAEHQFGQLVARRSGERRRGIEPAPDLRGVDAQEPHAPDRGDIDRVAVDNRAHQHGIRRAAHQRGGRRQPQRR
jgi:hypothetical protein